MEKIKRYLVQDGPVVSQLGALRSFQDLFARQALASAALAINAGSAATWKMGNSAALPYVINGQLATKAAATAQAVPTAVTWAAVASTYNAGGFLIALDAAGTVFTYPTNVTASTVSSANALSGLLWPTVPESQCVIGAVVVYNTAANTAFTAGTTALDAANIGVQYINITGPFYPVTTV